MSNNFEEQIFREFNVEEKLFTGNLIKASDAEIVGKIKVAIEEDSHDGVKVILKKDLNDSIRELKFVCSCGQAKSIALDYTEQ